MVSARELLTTWGIPFIPHYGVTLVERSHAHECVRKILQEGCRLKGYEGFTLFGNGQVQPHQEWSASWSESSRPPLGIILAQLDEPPPEVTHFEFAFAGRL
jgi:hypothetical protein